MHDMHLFSRSRDLVLIGLENLPALITKLLKNQTQMT